MSESERWRSEAAYNYVDELRPSELAWEFLRRNPEYQKAYRQLVSIDRLTEQAAREFAEQWGLRFRRRSHSLSARTADLLDPANRSRGDNVRPRPPS